MAECGGCIAHQGHVIAQLHGEAGGGLYASVGEQADGNNMRHPALLELKIKVGTGKAAVGPVLLDDDVAGLRHKVGMPVPAPLSLYESASLRVFHQARGEQLRLRPALARIRKSPALAIARLISAVGNEE